MENKKDKIVEQVTILKDLGVTDYSLYSFKDVKNTIIYLHYKDFINLFSDDEIEVADNFVGLVVLKANYKDITFKANCFTDEKTFIDYLKREEEE